MVKIGTKSLGDARIKKVIWDHLLATNPEIIHSLAVFGFCKLNASVNYSQYSDNYAPINVKPAGGGGGGGAGHGGGF